jgi:ribosomal-protein-alanine N-acetyltransferase
MMIRVAVPDDITEMMRLAGASDSAAHWSVREYEALFAAEAPERVALVCELAEVIAGFAVARCGGEEWEIENVVVDPTSWRKGIGRALVEAVLGQARSRGAVDVFLEVRESNVAARALYGKSGFEEAGRRSRYYRDPEEDAVVMRMGCEPPYEGS